MTVNGAFTVGAAAVLKQTDLAVGALAGDVARLAALVAGATAAAAATATVAATATALAAIATATAAPAAAATTTAEAAVAAALRSVYVYPLQEGIALTTLAANANVSPSVSYNAERQLINGNAHSAAYL